MKTFCILEQGKTVNHEITLQKKKMFTTSKSDFYRLNWKTDQDPNAFLKQNGIFWSEGRSLLYKNVPKIYEYYIFLDEDVTFEDEYAAEKISYLLKKYCPLSATFHCEGVWTREMMKRQMRLLPKAIREALLEREAFPIKCFDLCAHVFSADFADLVFPVPYHGSDRSMHYAQWICSKLYVGKQICFGGIKIRNQWAERHGDGLNETVHSKALVNSFNKDTKDGSFNEEKWRVKSVGNDNLLHSIIHKVDKSKQRIAMQDLAAIYNIKAPGFVMRKELRIQ